MTSEDVRHFSAVGHSAGGSSITDYFGSFAELCGGHDGRRYDRELFHTLAAEIIEAVHRPAGDAQSLARPNFDGRAFNRPGKDALDTVEGLLVGIILVGWYSQLRPGGYENLEGW